jgi:hypothetical protein
MKLETIQQPDPAFIPALSARGALSKTKKNLASDSDSVYAPMLVTSRVFFAGVKVDP